MVGSGMLFTLLTATCQLTFRKFLDEVRIAAGDYKSLSKATQNGGKHDYLQRLDFANSVNQDSSPVQSSLMFDDVASFSEHLSKKRNKIISTVTHLFKNLKSGAGTESEKVETLQSQLSEMLAKEKVREVELARLRQEKDDASARLTDATIRFMNAAKRLDRLKSQTVQKIERQAMHQATASAGGPDGGEAASGSDEDGVRVSEGQLADLEQARKEAEAVANKQKEELQQLQNENTRLSSQVTDFTIKVLIF
jgi:E3 ubiquitin-protein ligase BRE1